MLLLYLAKWNAVLAVTQQQKGTKFHTHKKKSVSAYCWVFYSSSRSWYKSTNASLTQNQCLQCVTPPLMHAKILRPCNATELNNDGMFKLGNVHYQTEPTLYHFFRRDLINDDFSFCSHILLAIDLQCQVFSFWKASAKCTSLCIGLSRV